MQKIQNSVRDKGHEEANIVKYEKLECQKGNLRSHFSCVPSVLSVVVKAHRLFHYHTRCARSLTLEYLTQSSQYLVGSDATELTGRRALLLSLIYLDDRHFLTERLFILKLKFDTIPGAFNLPVIGCLQQLVMECQLLCCSVQCSSGTRANAHCRSSPSFKCNGLLKLARAFACRLNARFGRLIATSWRPKCLSISTKVCFCILDFIPRFEVAVIRYIVRFTTPTWLRYLRTLLFIGHLVYLHCEAGLPALSSHPNFHGYRSAAVQFLKAECHSLSHFGKAHRTTTSLGPRTVALIDEQLPPQRTIYVHQLHYLHTWASGSRKALQFLAGYSSQCLARGALFAAPAT